MSPCHPWGWTPTHLTSCSACWEGTFHDRLYAIIQCDGLHTEKLLCVRMWHTLSASAVTLWTWWRQTTGLLPPSRRPWAKTTSLRSLMECLVCRTVWVSSGRKEWWVWPEYPQLIMSYNAQRFCFVLFCFNPLIKWGVKHEKSHICNFLPNLAAFSSHTLRRLPCHVTTSGGN